MGSMGVGALIGGVGKLVGGIMQSNAASDASSAELSYLNQALNYEKGVYSDATTNLTPWISGGQSALSSLMGALGLGDSTATQNYWKTFTNTPYYTFPLAQATTSMDQAAAAKGLSLSSGQLASLGKMGAGYASSNFKDYLTSLNTLSGSGQTAATSLGTIGSNIANTVSGTTNQMASAAGSGILGSAAGLSQGIQGLTSAFNTGGTGSSYSGSGSGSTTLGSLFSSLFGGGGGGSSGADLSGGAMTTGLY